MKSMDSGPEKRREILPSGMSVDEIFMLPEQEIDLIATRAGVSSNRLLEMLMAAAERKVENLAQTNKLKQEIEQRSGEQVRQMAEPIAQARELVDISKSADFFELGKDGSLVDADHIESGALKRLEKLTTENRRRPGTPEKEIIRRMLLRAYAIRLRITFEKHLEAGDSRTDAFSKLADEFKPWRRKGDNIPELGDALDALHESIALKRRFGDVWDKLEATFIRVADGKGTEDDNNLVRNFGRAVRGVYYRGVAASALARDYQVDDMAKLVRNFASRYREVAKRKIDSGGFDPHTVGEGMYGIAKNFPKHPRPRRSNDELEHF